MGEKYSFFFKKISQKNIIQKINNVTKTLIVEFFNKNCILFYFIMLEAVKKNKKNYNSFLTTKKLTKKLPREQNIFHKNIFHALASMSLLPCALDPLP